ncbi:Similar to Gen: Flap endonuclease GEN (Drosophila pseudoobscura pseudoobscura) [Cotesia congregata]|uniref:Similar to Gen: Flap endonuclease GEN (Drosophila pseudoobscura pseudoobscura) n=1 Tax=Cotesia congregata TaxID=51543 RepID=A0A8J2H6A5_COTCN|nr:Similar to Gen: Flap endonuclease GEN (Drosophila pseudoobscura pseudoobscura) [Cotesia congregata]
MGVTGLWNIITPLSKAVALAELRGKSVAVDLSCWIVDSSTVGPDDGCLNKHLRNIFFRTVALLMNGINPVFVLEGTAPVLKHDVIRERSQMRNKKKTETKKDNQRSNGRGYMFNRTVNDCKMMLNLMGLTCVKAHGEAEAINFTITDKIGFGSSVEEYSLERIEKIYSIGRNKMIGLALLCGCDYDSGIPGVGKEGAIKLLRAANEKDILNRLKNWRTDGSIYKLETAVAASKNISDEMKKLISNELLIRKKCIAIDSFPNQELIDEFTVRKGKVPRTITKWECPNVLELVKFMEKKLKWTADYTIEKVFPLLTRWHIENQSKQTPEPGTASTEELIPKVIKKIRTIQSVCYYEIEWEVISEIECFIKLGEEETEDNCKRNLITTLEPIDLVKLVYPSLVEGFEDAKNAKKKSRKKPKPVEGDKENVVKPKNSRKLKAKPEETQEKKIYDFFMKTKNTRKSGNQDNLKLAELNGSVSSLFDDLVEQDFSTDVDEDSPNMSMIVEKMYQHLDGAHKEPIDISSPKANDKINDDTVNTTLKDDLDEFDIPYIPLSDRIK